MLGNVGVQGTKKTQLQFNIVWEVGGGYSFVCLTMHGLNFNLHLKFFLTFLFLALAKYCCEMSSFKVAFPLWEGCTEFLLTKCASQQIFKMW